MREYCRECAHRDRSDGRAVTATGRDSRGFAVFAQQHHGKSCRFSRCTEHCTCTRAQKREWVTAVREELQRYTRAAHRLHPGYYIGNRVKNSKVLFTCIACNDLSSHACVQHVVEATSANPTQISAYRMCGRCCEKSSCRPVNTTCTTAHQAVGEFKNCHDCGRLTPISGSYVTEEHPDRVWCLPCAGTSQCQGCSRIYNTGRMNHELRGITQCSRCLTCQDEGGNRDGTCCRCPQQNVSSLRLHTIGVYKGHMKYAAKVSPTRNPLTRTIGVELEVAGFKDPKRGALADLYNTCVKWHAAIGTDSSINSPTGNGVEIRTSPAAGVKFVAQLGEVMLKIRQAGGFVNDSCGLHVHVGLNDVVDGRNELLNNAGPYVGGMNHLHHEAMGRIMLAWEQVEGVFYKMVSAKRDGGRYCNRMMKQTDYTYTRKNIVAVSGQPCFTYRNYSRIPTSGWTKEHYTPADLAASLLPRLSRYTGLNIKQAFDKYHTVEFRLHHGCLDSDTVTSWALLCCAFIDKVLTTKFDSLMEVGIKPDPVRFVHMLAPTDAVREYVEKLLRADLRASTPVKRIKKVIKARATDRRAA